MKITVRKSPLPFWERAGVRGVNRNVDPSSALRTKAELTFSQNWEKGTTTL